MSRICGIVAPRLPPYEISSFIAHMVETMRHEPWHRVDLWTDTGIGLGHTSIGAVNPAPQPVQLPGDFRRIVTAGKLIGRESLERELTPDATRPFTGEEDPAFILRLCQQCGFRRLSELNGIFVFSIWDPSTKTLCLVSDRHGMRPLYYYHDAKNDVFCFASEIKAIACLPFVPRKVNWTAWNVFLRLGFLTGEMTFFEHVHRAPAASVLTVSQDGLKSQRYWDYDQIPVRDTFDEQEDVDRLVALFRQSMKRCHVPGRPIVAMLSGGLDSRGIVADLCRQQHPFACYTTRKFAPEDADEKIARILAQRLGIELGFVELPDDILTTVEARKNRLLDYESDEHAWLLPLMDQLPTGGAISFDGIGQDLFCDEPLHAHRNKVFQDLYNFNLHKRFISEWLCEKNYFLLKNRFGQLPHDMPFFDRNIRDHFTEDAFMDVVAQSFWRYQGHPHAYIFAHLLTRTRREVALASFQLALNRVETFCPYLENDYFEFLMSCPTSARAGENLRTLILHRGYPTVAQLPSTAVASDVKAHSQAHAEFYRLQLHYIARAEWQLLRHRTPPTFSRMHLAPMAACDLMLAGLAAPWSARCTSLAFRYTNHRTATALNFLRQWLVTQGISISDF